MSSNEEVTVEMIDAELNAILAKDDTEIMLDELRELFGADFDVDSRFTIAQVITAMERSFEQGKAHIEMLNRAKDAAKSTAALDEQVRALLADLAQLLDEVKIERRHGHGLLWGEWHDRLRSRITQALAAKPTPDAGLGDDALARIGEAAEGAVLSEMSWPEIGEVVLTALREHSRGEEVLTRPITGEAEEGGER